MTDIFGFGIRFSVIGILIVFMVLAVIAMAVAFMKRLDLGWQDKEQKREAAAVHKDPTIDTTTLVLITAAVATMLKGRYHIRSIRRLLPKNAPRSSWSMQGRAILHGSHVVPKKR